MGTTFAAIAFHPDTLEYGYTNDCETREEAESEASQGLGSGYHIAAWGGGGDEGGYIALARSPNGIWNGGSGLSLNEAERDAIRKCENRGGTECYIVCSVYSG